MENSRCRYGQTLAHIGLICQPFLGKYKHPDINQYRIANENFLLEKSKEEGIITLENGICDA